MTTWSISLIGFFKQNLTNFIVQHLNKKISTLTSDLALASTAHCDKDVYGRGRQDDPDGDHDVVEGDVVAVLQLETEHHLGGKFEHGAGQVPVKRGRVFGIGGSKKFF